MRTLGKLVHRILLCVPEHPNLRRVSDGRYPKDARISGTCMGSRQIFLRRLLKADTTVDDRDQVARKGLTRPSKPLLTKSPSIRTVIYHRGSVPLHCLGSGG